MIQNLVSQALKKLSNCLELEIVFSMMWKLWADILLAITGALLTYSLTPYSRALLEKPTGLCS
jgi:hypothetical protein